MLSGMPTPDEQRLNPRDGHAAIVPGGSEVLRTYQQIQERIEHTFSDPRYEPPKLPAVALELLELARRPDVEVRDVVSLIEKDPVLASRLLRHVQSPLYAGGAEIRSLHRALMHLGLVHIRDIALELTVGARVFRAEHYAEAMDCVALHSRLTAHLTQVVCRHAGYDASQAFLCGLLHDVGLAVGLIALGDVPQREDRPSIEVALPVLFEMHVELGARVARGWHLAPEVVNVILHHHELADANGRVHSLAAVVCLAEYLANELCGYGEDAHHLQLPPGGAVARYDQTAPRQVELACATLGLDAQTMEVIRAEAVKLIDNFEASRAVGGVNAGADIAASAPAHIPAPAAATPMPREVKRSAGSAAPSGLWASVRGLFRLG